CAVRGRRAGELDEPELRSFVDVRAVFGARQRRLGLELGNLCRYWNGYGQRRQGAKRRRKTDSHHGDPRIVGGGTGGRTGPWPGSSCCWLRPAPSITREGANASTSAALEELARREGRHVLPGVRNARGDRQPPGEGRAEPGRFAFRRLEVILSTRESIGPLLH